MHILLSKIARLDVTKLSAANLTIAIRSKDISVAS